MKRPRSQRMMFSQQSDSDSDAAPTSSRLKSFCASHPPLPAAAVDQPDSLDAFMSTLTQPALTASCPDSVPPPPNTRTPLSFSSSDEDNCKPTRAVASLSDHEQPHSPSQTTQPPSQQPLILPRIDFSSQPSPEVNRLQFSPPSHLDIDPAAITSKLSSFRATVRNGTAPILTSFDDLSPPAPQPLVNLLSTSFPAPTPVQAITFPFLFSGRDLIAVAQTGSGKTLAYALPLLTHVSCQRGSSRSGRGPVGLVVAPTRELALQISDVLNDFGKHASVSSCCVVGGVQKYAQYKQVHDGGAGIIVCTPGRFIDMLRMRACRMLRCSFVVLDEADRMLDMGFGPQVRTIFSQIRPDAQRALFSATMPDFVKRLASRVLNDPVHVSLTGANGRRATSMVNENVKDTFICFDSDIDRRKWLLDHLSDLLQSGLVIVFCARRDDSAALANVIRGIGMPAACVHGETEQMDREGLLRMFRAGELPLLVTTDVSARGLDIADVGNVVNYGCAKSWEWHVHRVGRTGRASRTGTAYTLMDRMSRTDGIFACEAVEVLRKDKRSIPSALLELEASSQDTGKERNSRGRGRRHKKRGR